MTTKMIRSDYWLSETEVALPTDTTVNESLESMETDFNGSQLDAEKAGIEGSISK